MSNKLLKSELKEIVKECLLEILEDGISMSPSRGNGRMGISESRNRRNRRTSFDHVEWSKNHVEKPAVDYVEEAKKLSDDPILAEVLADSHRTMRERMAAESMGPSAMSGDFAARQAATSDPESLFGDASSNWAALAFND